MRINGMQTNPIVVYYCTVDLDVVHRQKKKKNIARSEKVIAAGDSGGGLSHRTSSLRNLGWAV